MPSLTSELRESFHPNILLPSIVAGGVAGVLAVTFMFSYSAVMFTEDLAVLVPRATGAMLFGAVIIAVISALFGAIRGTVALPQDNPTAIIVVMISAMQSTLATANSPDMVYLHVAVIIFLSTALAALVFFAIGHWRLASMVQYIPYPVIGGFLAGTGWLLFKGAFSVMGNVPLDFSRLPELMADINLWWPGVLYAAIVMIVTTRFNHFLVMPGLIVTGLMVFYAIMQVTNTSIDHAVELGYLLQPFGEEGLWQPLNSDDLMQIRWELIWQQAGGIATMVTIAVISILLNLTALESTFEIDIDLNKELRTAGYANVGASFVGGLIGYPYVSLSTLGHRMKGDSRLVGLVVALVCFLALTVGATMLSYFPKFILGGLVLFIGFSFLYDWVILSFGKLSKSDMSIIILIILVVETIGFLEAIAVGIAASAVLFIVKYSHIDVVRHSFSGADMHANIERPASHHETLRREGDQTQIIKLQGYLFFATASGLLNRITQLLTEKKTPLTYLLLDFQLVSGLDTSALHSFVKVKQLATEYDVHLVFSGLNEDVLLFFQEETFSDGDAVVDEVFTDLDSSLEWCEDRLLQGLGIDPRPAHHPIDELLANIFANQVQAQRFKSVLSKRELKAGDHLLREHDKQSALFFVEEGDLTVLLQGVNDEPHRLRRAGSGSIIGVASFFLIESNEALVSVKAESETVVHTLSKQTLKELKEEHPEIVTEFHEYALRILSARLASNLNTMEAILR
ncbi:MAG: SulP family sulfate permease [Candidatus Latescibacterota bacterium]|jgi:SulP family sulfate permease